MFERLLPRRFSKYVTRRCTRIAGKNTRKCASRQILLLRTIRRCWQASNPRDCRGFSNSLIRVDARAASATGQRPLFLPLFPFSPDPAYIFMRRSPTAATTASGIAVVGLRYKKKRTIVEIAVTVAATESCLDRKEGQRRPRKKKKKTKKTRKKM